MVCNKNILICKLWSESEDINEFAKKLEEHGIHYYELYRSVVVPVPAMLCSDLRRDFIDDVLVLYIFGDPSSGCALYDVLVVTGYRFGVDDIILNGEVISTVHEYYGSAVEYVFSELKRQIWIYFDNPLARKVANVCLKVLSWLVRKYTLKKTLH